MMQCGEREAEGQTEREANKEGETRGRRRGKYEDRESYSRIEEAGPGPSASREWRRREEEGMK